MLRLRTFGAAFVADESGAPLTRAAGQRRLLAFLSVLAAAGDHGLSRDKIAGLLWPDATSERARQSVTQALYDARRALRADDLFVAGGDLRLNRERLASDVQEFEAALRDGELERAVELYQGPFLDGFFLPGSTEFEQWSTSLRTRYEDRVTMALDRLAERAEGAGDFRASVEWRKRRVAVRPLDASAAVALMGALARVGDRAGAIRHAQVHELLLRDQLGLAPDPAVAALAERLRGPVPWQPDAHRAGGVPAGAVPPAGPGGSGHAASVALARPAATVAYTEAASPSASAPPVATPAGSAGSAGVASVLSVEAPPETSAELVAVAPAAAPAAGSDAPAAGERTVPYRPIARHVVVGALVVVLAIVVAVAWLTERNRRPERPLADVRLRQQVVVAPFRVAGASASLAYLRDGLVELLSTRLADDTAARSVDAGAVLSAWRRAGLTGDADVPRDTVVRLAARLGAERVVIGNVVGTPSRVVLTATVVSVPDGALAGTATVEGPADSVTLLVDRLAGRLLVQEAGEEGALAGQTTTSLAALRAFLAGQAAFRRHDLAAAARGYERAVRQDSTFSLAALQLARTADRLQSPEDRRVALALAWRARSALGEQDGALLLTFAGPRYPAPSTVDEQLTAWARPTRLTPDRADSWYELGARYFQAGEALGLADARQRAATALRRALAVDAAYGPARQLLAQLAAGQPSEPAAGALPSDAALRDSTGPLAPFVRWRVAAARADLPALERLRDSLPRLGPANLRAIAQASQFDGIALGDARSAVELLRARAVQPVDRVEAILAEHALAMNEGRPRAATAALDRLDDLQPGSHAHLRLRVLDALYGDADPRAGAAAADELARRAAGPLAGVAGGRAGRAADACVLAQWRLRQDDTTDVARIVGQLRADTASPTAADARLVAATPAALCAELLQAAMAVTVAAREAPALVARLDSLALTAVTSADASAYAPILVARLHERLGDATAARAAVRRRVYMLGWPRYLATALREEGRYAARAGDVDGARVAYARFLALRADPDPELAARTAEVRQALAALAALAPATR